MHVVPVAAGHVQASEHRMQVHRGTAQSLQKAQATVQQLRVQRRVELVHLEVHVHGQRVPDKLQQLSTICS